MLFELPNLYQVAVHKLPNNRRIKDTFAYGFSPEHAGSRIVNDILIHEYMHDPEVPTIEMMRPLYFVEGAYGGPSIASGPIGPAHKRRYDLLEMKRKTREHNQNIGAPSHLQLTPCNKCKKQRKTQ